jgi:hypothetical protein
MFVVRVCEQVASFLSQYRIQIVPLLPYQTFDIEH